MKLAYKIGGIGLAGGASAGAYLLIPSSNVEKEAPIQNVGKELRLSVAKVEAKWEKAFTDKGYIPLVSFGDTMQLLGLLDAYKKENNIEEDGTASERLESLCNSFREKEDLEENDKAKAKRWCFKPRTVENILKSLGKNSIFNFEAESEEDAWNQRKLKELARLYIENNDDSMKMESGWNNSTLLVMKESDLDGDLNNFKDACLNGLKTESYVDKFEEKIKKIDKWCSEES